MGHLPKDWRDEIRREMDREMKTVLGPGFVEHMYGDNATPFVDIAENFVLLAKLDGKPDDDAVEQVAADPETLAVVADALVSYFRGQGMRTADRGVEGAASWAGVAVWVVNRARNRQDLSSWPDAARAVVRAWERISDSMEMGQRIAERDRVGSA